MDPVWIIVTLMDCVQKGLHKARVAHELSGHLLDIPWPPSRPNIDVDTNDHEIVIHLHSGNLAIYAYVPKVAEQGEVER
jgi:hypothetical protein